MNEKKGSSTQTTHDKFAILLKSAIHFNSLCILLHCLTSEPKGLYFTFFILLCSNPIWHSNIKECIKSFSAQQNVLLKWALQIMPEMSALLQTMPLNWPIMPCAFFCFLVTLEDFFILNQQFSFFRLWDLLPSQSLKLFLNTDAYQHKNFLHA